MDKSQAIRTAAIDHHHMLSDWFDASYKQAHKDRFTNEFTYGRSKIDSALKETFASLPQGAAMLDVGCGTGEQLLLAQSMGLVVHGLEPAQGMREIAQRNVPDAEIKDGVTTSLPFPENSFDAVIQIEVLRYLDRNEIHQAMTEVKRVLRPSGKVVITLVNRWALDGFFVRQRWRQWQKGKEFSATNPHCEFFSPAEAVRQLEAAGLVNVKAEGRMFAPLRPLWRLSPSVAARIAKSIEDADDMIHRRKWTHRFAGHLIVTGEAPA